MATEGGKALLKWSDYDKDRVKQLSADLMKRSRATYDRIGSLPSADVNYENTLKASLTARLVQLHCVRLIKRTPHICAN